MNMNTVIYAERTDGVQNGSRHVRQHEDHKRLRQNSTVVSDVTDVFSQHQQNTQVVSGRKERHSCRHQLEHQKTATLVRLVNTTAYIDTPQREIRRRLNYSAQS